MGMTIEFLKYFFEIVFFISPVIIFLIVSISLMGLYVGKVENLSIFDSLYFAFITAATIGYGDFTPKRKVSKILSVLIGVQGLILSGILVAIAVSSVTEVAKHFLTLD